MVSAGVGVSRGDVAPGYDRAGPFTENFDVAGLDQLLERVPIGILGRNLALFPRSQMEHAAP